jgi:hypothetical protein
VIAILAGGLIAGTLDIGAAALIYALSPGDILRSIAGGLLGAPALQGGIVVPDWGSFFNGPCRSSSPSFTLL